MDRSTRNLVVMTIVVTAAIIYGLIFFFGGEENPENPGTEAYTHEDKNATDLSGLSSSQTPKPEEQPSFTVVPVVTEQPSFTVVPVATEQPIFTAAPVFTTAPFVDDDYGSLFGTPPEELEDNLVFYESYELPETYEYAFFTIPHESPVQVFQPDSDSPIEAVFAVYILTDETERQIEDTLTILRQGLSESAVNNIGIYLNENKYESSLEDTMETFFDEEHNRYIHVLKNGDAVIIEIYKESAAP